MVGRTCFELQYRPVGDLKNNPRNARVHSKHQIRQIASSIKAFGFTNPVLLDKDNTIVAGHGRVAAAKLLGISDVPTIRLENLSSDQLRAYVLADNRLAEKAGWDKSILAIELQHLISIESDFDVTVTGFEIPEIDLVLSTPSAKPDPDDVFELSETPEPISRPGDFWRLGRHRILCGSSVQKESYSTLMATRRAAVVFTDPEIAWAGLTEEQAKAENLAVEVVRYPWAASGRAQSLGRTDGLTKLLIEPDSERILGIGIVGVSAGDMISEGVVAIEMGATARDLAESIHPHPTLSETLAFAAEAFLGTATEIYRPRPAHKPG